MTYLSQPSGINLPLKLGIPIRLAYEDPVCVGVRNPTFELFCNCLSDTCPLWYHDRIELFLHHCPQFAAQVLIVFIMSFWPVFCSPIFFKVPTSNEIMTEHFTKLPDEWRNHTISNPFFISWVKRPLSAILSLVCHPAECSKAFRIYFEETFIPLPRPQKSATNKDRCENQVAAFVIP